METKNNNEKVFRILIKNSNLKNDFEIDIEVVNEDYYHVAFLTGVYSVTQVYEDLKNLSVDSSIYFSGHGKYKQNLSIVTRLK